MTTDNGKHTGTRIKRKNDPGYWTIGQRLGSGNEGEVYDSKEDRTIAIKIYHDDKRPETDKSAKLEFMQGMPNRPLSRGQPTLAWPKQLIKTGGGNTLVGFVMDRINVRRNYVQIGIYCNKTARQLNPLCRHHTESDVRTTTGKAIEKLAHIAHELHSNQIVMGDINDHNLLINPETGDISILDCDSFQVRDERQGTTYRCTVGRPEYTAPELLRAQKLQCTDTECEREPRGHRVGYACTDRTPDHDMFAIAVIFFRMLMNGSHPYDCIYKGPAGGAPQTIRDRIENGYWAYGPNRHREAEPPRNMEKQYQRIPEQVRQLFERSF